MTINLSLRLLLLLLLLVNVLSLLLLLLLFEKHSGLNEMRLLHTILIIIIILYFIIRYRQWRCTITHYHGDSKITRARRYRILRE